MYKDIRIYSEKTHSININNSGTLNEQSLQFAKKTFLFDLIREHSNELIKHTQHYPQQDICDVDLKADFMIINTKHYNKLIALKDSLKDEHEQYKNIEFPKLEP